jgi:hypothetical protein
LSEGVKVGIQCARSSPLTFRRFGHAINTDEVFGTHNLRTTNVVESSFATVRHRTVRSKGCLSNKTALAMIFKLAEGWEAELRNPCASYVIEMS